jgi:hypothetical protein
MGELPSRLKTHWIILILFDYTTKSGFRTSSKISELASNARMGLPTPNKHEYYSLKEPSNIEVKDRSNYTIILESKTIKNI